VVIGCPKACRPKNQAVGTLFFLSSSKNAHFIVKKLHSTEKKCLCKTLTIPANIDDSCIKTLTIYVFIDESGNRQ